MGSDVPKFNVCLIGSGGVGTIGSVVLENSGRARVTAVLRSKYKVVSEKGWDIESVDHGTLKGWKPSRSQHPPPLYVNLLLTCMLSCGNCY